MRAARLGKSCPAPLTPVLRPQVALAVALDLRTFLRLRPGAEGRLSVSLPGVGVRRSWDTPSLRALRGRIAGKGRGKEELPRGSEGLSVPFGACHTPVTVLGPHRGVICPPCSVSGPRCL